MAFTGKLGNLVVEFTTQGVAAVKEATAQVQSALSGLQGVALTVGTTISQALASAVPVAAFVGNANTISASLAGIQTAARGAQQALSQTKAPPAGGGAGGAAVSVSPKVDTSALGKIGETVDGAFTNVKKTSEGIASTVSEKINTALVSMGDKLQAVGKGMEMVGRAASAAFGGAAERLGGFVKAGVSSSSMGELLSFQMGMLSREIASVFLPVIKSVSEHLANIINWFRSLSGAQQDNLAKWLSAAAVILTVSKALPIVTEALSGVFGMLKLVGTGISGLLAGSLGGILPLLGALIGAFTAVGAGATMAEGGFGALFTALQPVLDAIQSGLALLVDAFAPLKDVAERVFGSIANLAGVVIEALANLMAALAPVIETLAEALIPVIDGVTAAIQELSAMIDENTIKWIATIGTFFLALSIIPKVVSAIGTIITALRAMTVAKIMALAFSGPSGWAQLAIGVAAAGAALGTFAVMSAAANKHLEEGTKHLKGMKGAAEGLRTLAPPTHGFETSVAAYDRIAEASVKMGFGKGTAEKHLDVAEKQMDLQAKGNETLDKCEKHLGRLEVPFVVRAIT